MPAPKLLQSVAEIQFTPQSAVVPIETQKKRHQNKVFDQVHNPPACGPESCSLTRSATELSMLFVKQIHLHYTFLPVGITLHADNWCRVVQPCSNAANISNLSIGVSWRIKIPVLSVPSWGVVKNLRLQVRFALPPWEINRSYRATCGDAPCSDGHALSRDW